MSIAQSHDHARSNQLAGNTGLAHLARIRLGVHDSHLKGSREASVPRAACSPGTNCLHPHGSIGTRRRDNGGATSLDKLAWEASSRDEGSHRTCGLRA